MVNTKIYEVIDKETQDVAQWNTKIERENENNPVVIKMRPKLLKKIQSVIDFKNANEFLELITKALKIDTTSSDYDFTNPKPKVALADVTPQIKVLVDSVNDQINAQLKSGKKINYEKLSKSITEKLPSDIAKAVINLVIPKPKNETIVFDF